MTNRIKVLPLLGGLLMVYLHLHSVFGGVSVEDNQNSIVITNDHYSVTFDKSKGGTIVKLGKRKVQQADGVDGFLLAGDPRPRITVKKSANHVVVSVKAFYFKNKVKTPSGMHAEYRYDFHADSPAVRLKATVRQFKVPTHADVYGYHSWKAVSVFAISKKAAFKKSFGGGSLKAKVFFLPGSENPLDVASKVSTKLSALVNPVLRKGKTLFEESFKNNAKWTDICGTWIAEGGALAEKSPDGRWAWTVAGEKDWKDYIVESDVLSNNGCHAYLCVRWIDIDNHYELHYLEYPVNAMRINRVVNGRRRVLAEVAPLPDLRVRPYTKLALAVQGNRIRAYRNGELMLEANDSALTHGRVALGAVSNLAVWFYNVGVYQSRPAKSKAPTVRISQPVQRHAFYRDEKSASVRFVVSPEKPADNLSLTFVLSSDLYPMHGDLARKEIKLGALGPNEEREIAFKFKPASLRSGDYALTATVKRGDLALAVHETEIFLRRRPNPDRMLVCEWGRMGEDPQALSQYGFNQYKVLHESTMSRWTSDGKYRTPDNPLRIFSSSPGGKAKRQHIIDTFDEALKHGMWGFMHLAYMVRVAEGVTDAYALKRDGSGIQNRGSDHFSTNRPRMNPWHPKSVEVIRDFFAKALSAWKDLPAWRSVLLNSESERELDVYGNDYWLAMAEKELGFKVPKDVSYSWGLKGKPLPKDGIVASDDPYYRFYRWWHERGEGQGVLHAKIAKTVKKVRPDVITWHDPALRQPFVRGRLAGLDQIRHWNYAWPNVTRFALIADELRLAAVDGQERIFMLQLIGFSDVPIPKSGPHWPYIKRKGKMYLIAHSPSIVREGTWLALSRGVSGMGYHGISTVDRLAMRRGDARGEVEGVGYRSYMYSNPDSLLAIKEMSERVMQPYGMVIKRLTPARGDVVMLLSTANVVFSYRDAEDLIMDEGGHMYAKLQAAHVPVDLAYEVDFEEKGLDGYKAVALPACKVLPRHIYDMIRKFEDRGGIVIADQFLVPKFSNVLVLPRKASRRRGEAGLEKEHIAQARDVHKGLDDRIKRWADCDSPSVVLSVLEDGADKYLFAINNLRRTGDYMMPWGRVLDDGVSQTAVLSVPDDDCVIYDALDQRLVKGEARDGRLSWRLALGPGEGRIFVVRPKAIARITINVPETVKKGDEVKVSIAVEDKGGEIATGLIPLRVTLTDSQGTPSDYSDYYLAQKGRATVTLPIATNEPSGDWSVTVRELFGGVKERAFLRVLPVEKVVKAVSKKKAPPGFVRVPEFWLFRTDPEKIGEKEKWFAPRATRKGWEPLSTHDFWDTGAGVGYVGDGWYAVKLTIPVVKDKRVKLILGAVDENYTLWVNGKYISDNLAAGTTMWDKPVTIDITDHYRGGRKNHIVVRVKNTLRAGGIWKPVRIVAR